jgi:ribonuclease HI
MGLEVYIDGACEPVNPGGTSSYGLIVKDGGKLLLAQGAVMGSGKGMSSNVAEYGGLIAFLYWYAEIAKPGSVQPVVHSDSMMLVMQMIGQWKARAGLYLPYHNTAKQLIHDHHFSICFRWIPREENTEADALAKKALIDAGVKMKIEGVATPWN